MKRLIYFLIAFVIIFSFSACTVTTSEKKITTPEECMQNYFELLISNKFEKAYDDCFSDVSKTLVDKVDFSNEQKSVYFTEDITLTDVLVKSSEKLDNADNNIYLVKGILKFTQNGENKTEDFSEYVIKQKADGFYKFLYKGILMRKKFQMKSTHESNLVHADNVVIYESTKGIFLDITFKNDTGKSYSFGSDTPSIMQIIIGNDKYSSEMKSVIKLEGNSEVTLSGFFEKASGQPSNISVSGIFQIGQDGTILNEGAGQIYSVKMF